MRWGTSVTKVICLRCGELVFDPYCIRAGQLGFDLGSNTFFCVHIGAGIYPHTCQMVSEGSLPRGKAAGT